VSNLNCLAGQADHTFYEGDVSIGGRFERDDIEPPDRSMRKIVTNCSRIVCGKRYLVEEEMIADKDGRFHGFRRDLRCLRDVARENQDKNDRKREAFDPFAKRAFVSRGQRVVRDQLIQPDMRSVKDDELIEKYVWNVGQFRLGSRFLNHLRQLFLY
jgi:hypothetical protein